MSVLLFMFASSGEISHSSEWVYVDWRCARVFCISACSSTCFAWQAHIPHCSLTPRLAFRSRIRPALPQCTASRMAVSVTPLQTQIYMMSALSLLFSQDQLAVTRASQSILLALVLNKYLVTVRE